MERDRESDGPAPSSAEEFRALLAQLLASDAFPASPRRRKLLAYVVTQTLAGRGEQLKAYDLAISVLGRDASFDAQADPIVRIEMGRLRRDLDHYYANQGRADPTRIAIPKGRYLAVLEKWWGAAVSHYSTRSETPLAGDHPEKISALHGSIHDRRSMISLHSRDATRIGMSQPAVVVQRFRNVGAGEIGQHLAVGLTEGLIADLMRFDCLDVFVGLPSRSGGEAAAGESGDLRFLLDGIVERALNRVRVTARLSDARSGQVLWIDRFDRLLPAVGLLHVTAELTAAIAGRLASPSGAIHQSALRRLDRVGFQDAGSFAYASVQRAFRYRQTFSRNDYSNVRADLELAVRREPDCAAAQAMLAFTHMEAARFGIVAPAAKGDELQAGLQAAQVAVELAPDSALALQSLAALRYACGEVEVAERLQRRAIARNPSDPEGLAQLGWRLIASGQRAEGANLMQKAIGGSLVVPAWYHMVMALAAFLAGDLDAARAAAPLGKHYGMGPGFATLALIEAEAGHKLAARTALAEALRRSELLRRDPVAYWQTYQVAPEIIGRFNAGLARAGL